MDTLIATEKLKELGPPICPACGLRVFRAGRMAEMQFNDPSLPDRQVCLCMHCATPWMVSMDGAGALVLRALTPEEEETLPQPFVDSIAQVMRNKAVAKRLEVTTLELAEMMDEFLMFKQPRRFDA